MLRFMLSSRGIHTMCGGPPIGILCLGCGFCLGDVTSASDCCFCVPPVSSQPAAGVVGSVHKGPCFSERHGQKNKKTKQKKAPITQKYTIN